mmetsp:Transcript_65796/g.146891  ORF Transcript_65796/g.146891 Transcript_65796/m.146891 type:complete len:83 (-) Transcript_65796:797-1045(-)
MNGRVDQPVRIGEDTTAYLHGQWRSALQGGHVTVPHKRQLLRQDRRRERAPISTPLVCLRERERVGRQRGTIVRSGLEYSKG